jgi:nucleoside-diphosphate-sugar epimerase
MDGVRTIIHVAGVTKAKRDEDYRRGNVGTTAALLDAARQLPHLRRFCLISSLTVAGPSSDGTPLTEDRPPHPLTAYARSKWEAEQLVRAAAPNLPVTIIRPPTVYGPRDRDVLEMFRWVRYGLHPLIGSPEKTLSLVHVRDLVRGVTVAAMDPSAEGRTYYVSDKEPYRYDELIRLIAAIVGRRPIKVRFPVPLLFAVARIVEAVSFFGPRPAVLSVDKARDMVQPHWVCDPRLIEAELGVRSEIQVEEGLRSTYGWYREHGWL